LVFFKDKIEVNIYINNYENVVGSNGQLQPNIQLIREDLVQFVSNPQNVGIVSRLSGDSTSNSNLEMANEDNDSECILVGFASVLWLKSQEIDEDVLNLRVIDQSFTLGDVVAPLENPIGQMGIVMDVCMFVDLELTNGKIVEGIDSCRLQHVSYNFLIQYLKYKYFHILHQKFTSYSNYLYIIFFII